MVDSEAIAKASIFYYGREKYYHCMTTESANYLKVFGGDPLYRFYLGISLIRDDQLQEGMRELETVKTHPEYGLGSMLALIHAHRKCKTVDREAINELDSKFKEERRKANEKSLYSAGLFLFLSGKYDKAKEYVDRALKSSSITECLVIKGWLSLNNKNASDSTRINSSIEYFEKVINKEKNIDALMGKAKFFEERLSFNNSLECLNQIIVSCPNFVPALIEKMKIQLALQEWDQAIDCANRALYLDSNCVEARKYKILHEICVLNDHSSAEQHLNELITALNSSEPRNAELWCECAQLFSRVCGRNAPVLNRTLALAEKAVTLDDKSSTYITELGHQYLMQCKHKEALKCFRDGSQLDDSSTSSLIGIVFVLLLEGHHDVAEQQLEFLKEIHKVNETTPELLFLTVTLSRVRGNKSNEATQNMTDCVNLHLKRFRVHKKLFQKGLAPGSQYYIALNPDFIQMVSKQLLAMSPVQPVRIGQTIPVTLKLSADILEPVTKTCPGLTDIYFLLAKTKYLSGETKVAGNMLQHVMDELDATHVPSHLLMAEIYLHEGKFQQVCKSLERAVSFKFDIRDHPLYHVIKARAEKAQGNIEEALHLLQTALNLAGIKSTSNHARSKPKHQLETNEKVTLYLELMDVYTTLNQQSEAAQILQDALNDFRGTPEEIRISIARADLLVNSGDVEQALSILRGIGPEHLYYLQARERMADIYLNHRKDKRLYANCYKEIVEMTGSLQSQIMLGDAYMSVHEPEMAVEAYEQAMKINPKDTTLAGKIGKALVKTHNYNKAINYYKEAIKNDSNKFFRYDLAELLLRLKQLDKAEKIILTGLEMEDKTNSQDLASMMYETKLLLLLTQVYQKGGHNEHAIISTLTKARDIQTRVLKRVQVEQPNNVAEQKELVAKICCQMAENAKQSRDFERATRLYNEALIYNEFDSNAMLDLAKLYLRLGDLESCQSTCTTLLRNEPDNETATVMMADIMFRKNDYEAAMRHFKQLLSQKADYYDALGRLIEVLRRIGKLDECPSYLTKAEENVKRPEQEHGLNFCKGLYEWYIGNTNGALKLFNKARKSSDWRLKAIYNMIEICLNPDKDTLGGEVLGEMDLEYDNYEQDYQDAAIRTADKLIKELNSLSGDVNGIILSNFLLLATHNKNSIEKALSEFVKLMSTPLYKDHTGVILGVSTAYVLTKQAPKARNYLKRVAKSNWTFEEAEYLERCWLLLADIYIQSGKYDMSVELLKRVLEHNKSCCKAYEYMGYIMEKEQTYKDAAQYYELAWKFSNKSNPVIGFKLAFNYMKSKQYVDAIDVCNIVLHKYPNYPKIRKEILEKCRANIRI